MLKRHKVILAISLGIIVLLASTALVLDKFNIINFGIFADSTTPGLTGYYYQLNQADAYTVAGPISRIDYPYINYPYNTLIPPPGINREHFMVRWTGQVTVPQSGLYTFKTNSDDGVRIWANGTKVIDNWNLHSSTINTGVIYLNAGKIPVILDYFNGPIDSVIVLSWASPIMSERIVSFTPSSGSTSCGPNYCSTTQHCVVQGGYEGIPVNYSCQDNYVPTSWRFSLRGMLKDSGDKFLGDATVSVLDKSDPNNVKILGSKDTTGFAFSKDGYQYNYQIDQLSFPETDPFKNVYLSFAKNGKQPLEIPLGDSIKDTKPGGTNIVNKYIKDQALLDATGKLDIEGIVKDKNGAMVPNSMVTVYCDTPAAGTTTNCNSNIRYPWAYSRVDKNDVPHGGPQNYLISGVYDFKNDTTFDHVKISATVPAGYYYDANKDGMMQLTEKTIGSIPYIYLSSQDIKYDNISAFNGYIKAPEIILNKIPPTPLQVALAELAAWTSTSNKTKYSEGIDEAWCADFVSWVYRQAGYNIPRIPGSFDIKTYFVNNTGIFFWKNNPTASAIKPGDAILFSGADSPSGFHVAIVRSISSTQLVSIDGNIGDNHNLEARSCSLSVNKKTGRLICHRTYETLTIVGVGRGK